jgi:hypothetical protein
VQKIILTYYFNLISLTNFLSKCQDFWFNSQQLVKFIKSLGAVFMKQVKISANRWGQDYQHWLYAAFWQAR